jgi:hypothetical protein
MMEGTRRRLRGPEWNREDGERARMNRKETGHW